MQKCNVTTIIIIASMLLLSGCYISEKTYGVAYLHNYKTDSTEIELPYIIKGRGSLHNFTFERFTDTSAHWIYITNIQKEITADKLLLVYTKRYGSQSDLKGGITIEDSALTINFKIPRYNNKSVVKRWVKYEFNGSYKLQKVNQ